LVSDINGRTEGEIEGAEGDIWTEMQKITGG
jgi:hypothetical protein